MLVFGLLSLKLDQRTRPFATAQDRSPFGAITGWASRHPRMVMSTTRCARDRASAADQSTVAEERIILAGVSDRAAVAGQTHKHPANVSVTASRNRPVGPSRQCVVSSATGALHSCCLRARREILARRGVRPRHSRCHLGVAAIWLQVIRSRERAG